MRRVDLRLSAMSCPKHCCKCGGAQTDLRTFTERIALRALTPLRVSVTVPVCKSCAARKARFYLASVAVLAFSLVGFKLAASGYTVWRYMSAALFLVAVGLYIGAVRSTPIKILDYRPSSDMISLGCLHDGFAAELAALSGGTDAAYIRVRKLFWVLALFVVVLLVMAMLLGI